MTEFMRKTETRFCVPFSLTWSGTGFTRDRASFLRRLLMSWGMENTDIAGRAALPKGKERIRRSTDCR